MGWNQTKAKSVIQAMKFKKVSISKVMDTLTRHFLVIGQQTAYAVLLMVNSFLKRGTPLWAKRIIVGTLGYFLAPVDAIPDLTPVIGFTDDLGVLSFGLVTIASYINDDVRIKSRQQVKRMFGMIDLQAVKAVDERL